MKSKKMKIIALLLSAVGAAGLLTIPNDLIPAEHFSVCAAQSTLSAPKKPVSTTETDSIKLKWNAVSGADAYIVYYRTADTEEYQKYKTVKNPECLIKELTPGTAYDVKVTPIKLDEKNIVTERGKSAVWAVMTATYRDCVQNLKATTKLEGTQTDMYAGGEMVSSLTASITLSWDILPSADAYVISDGYNVVKKCEFTQKNGRAYATIKGLSAARKFKLTVYPVKFENDMKYKGKGKSITITTASPKVSQVLDLSTGSSFISLGNNTYVTTGEYKAWVEEMSIATVLALHGGDLSTLETDVENLERHYITYNETKIGIINFYTNPRDPYYLKIIIQEL